MRLSFSLSSEPVAGSWTVFVYALYSWTIDVSDHEVPVFTFFLVRYLQPVLINEACFTVQEYGAFSSFICMHRSLMITLFFSLTQIRSRPSSAGIYSFRRSAS